MSTERIFGTWDQPPKQPDEISLLWHKLAAQNVGKPDFMPNSGLSQRRAEITMLWTLFARMKPQVIVEVGVAQGGTFASWCQLAPDDAVIIAVDRCLDDCRPRPGDPVHPGISIRSDLSSSNGGGIYHLGKAGQTIIGVNGWTTEQSTKDKLIAALNGRKIDFLFHDASHERSMFIQDFEWMYPLVADGGVFATHDIQQSQHPECNKSEAWKTIKLMADYSACFEFLGSRNDDSLGIGVLIK